MVYNMKFCPIPLTSYTITVDSYMFYLITTTIPVLSYIKQPSSSTTPIARYVSVIHPINLLMTACDVSITLIGDEGKLPIGRLVFYQPLIILCTKPKSERLEISCYDIKLIAGRRNQESTHAGGKWPVN